MKTYNSHTSVLIFLLSHMPLDLRASRSIPEFPISQRPCRLLYPQKLLTWHFFFLLLPSVLRVQRYICFWAVHRLRKHACSSAPPPTAEVYESAEQMLPRVYHFSVLSFDIHSESWGRCCHQAFWDCLSMDRWCFLLLWPISWRNCHLLSRSNLARPWMSVVRWFPLVLRQIWVASARDWALWPVSSISELVLLVDHQASHLLRLSCRFGMGCLLGGTSQ